MASQVFRSDRSLGEEVMRKDGTEGTITSINFRYGGGVLYQVAWPDGVDRWHYEIEFKSESKVSLVKDKP